MTIEIAFTIVSGVIGILLIPLPLIVVVALIRKILL